MSVRRVVSNRGVQLGHEEAGLALVLIAHDVPRQGEPGVHHQLRVGLRGHQEVPKVGVVRLVLVPRISPSRNRLSVEHKNVEEGVEELEGEIKLVYNLFLISNLISNWFITCF